MCSDPEIFWCCLQFTFDQHGGKIKVKTAANVNGQRFLFFDGRAESWPTVLATYQSLSCRDLRNVSLVVASTPGEGDADFAKASDPEWLSITQDARDHSMSEGLAVPYGRYQADLQLSPTPNPAQWYTMLSNCDDVIDIDFVLTLLNPGGWWYEQFSVDEQVTCSSIPIAMLVCPPHPTSFATVFKLMIMLIAACRCPSVFAADAPEFPASRAPAVSASWYPPSPTICLYALNHVPVCALFMHA